MTYAIVVIAVLILDQAVKYWTNLTLALGETKALIPGFIEFLHTQNTGAAFGLFGDWSGARWVFVALMIIFCIAAIYVLSNDIVKPPLGRWTLVLIVAGGLGNCIDRVVNGYVIDMFHFQFKIFGNDFAIFNVADIFLTVCGVIFCVWLVFHKPEEPKKAPPPRHSAQRGTPQPQQGADYITQLKKPVARAKAELEPPHVAPAAPAAPRPRPAPQPAAPGDPFADFFSSPASSAAPPAAPQRTAPAPAPIAPRRDETASNPAAPAPSPKKDTDFTLEDILAEFSDK